MSIVNNRYYTSPDKAGKLHDDFRLLWDHVYRLSDENAELRKKMESNQPATATVGKPGGPSNTTINGIYVIGQQPADGNTIRYKKTSGQFEFGA